jgi:hypothetical protein
MLACLGYMLPMAEPAIRKPVGRSEKAAATSLRTHRISIDRTRSRKTTGQQPQCSCATHRRRMRSSTAHDGNTSKDRNGSRRPSHANARPGTSDTSSCPVSPENRIILMATFLMSNNCKTICPSTSSVVQTPLCPTDHGTSAPTRLLPAGAASSAAQDRRAPCWPPPPRS